MNSLPKEDLAEQLRFLVVEDETVTAIDLECMLEEMGHTVTAVAMNRGAADRILSADGNHFDAALVDANLAGKSAMPVVEILRSRHIPFAVASGYSRQHLQDLGFDEVSIEKPFRSQDVARTVHDLHREILKRRLPDGADGAANWPTRP